MDFLVNGGFTDWSKPSACSVTCGEGVTIQKRTCTKPAPQFGGTECDGDDEKSAPCTKSPCPSKYKSVAWIFFMHSDRLFYSLICR